MDTGSCRWLIVEVHLLNLRCLIGFHFDLSVRFAAAVRASLHRRGYRINVSFILQKMIFDPSTASLELHKALGLGLE